MKLSALSYERNMANLLKRIPVKRTTPPPFSPKARKLTFSLKSIFFNRHWYIIKDYITLRKLINILRCIHAFKTNRKHVSSYPFYVKIETTDTCNLKCPGCHDDTVERKNKFLNFSIYKELIDRLKNYLLEVSLYDQGEPLIDPLIIDYIKYANKNNIGTVVSSHFSMRLSHNKLTNLINSGLDYLIVAIDGITQETYEKYRVGGNLDLALTNLRKILEIRNNMHSRKPFIEWQMIDFNFNKSQQNQARILAKQMGVDAFVLKTDGYSIKLPDTYVRTHNCPIPWFSFAVECDGLVSACLRKDDEHLYAGDLNKASIIEIWNSASFQRIRQLPISNDEAKKYLCMHCAGYD